MIVLEKGGVAATTTARAPGAISPALEPFPEAWSEFALTSFRALDGQGVLSFTERETVRLVPVVNGDVTRERAPEGDEFRAREDLQRRYRDTFGDLSSYAGGLVYGGRTTSTRWRTR